jgi:hypothetical protein
MIIQELDPRVVAVCKVAPKKPQLAKKEQNFTSCNQDKIGERIQEDYLPIRYYYYEELLLK